MIYNDDDDNDDYDAVDGDGNDPDFITVVELEVKNTQHTRENRQALPSHL